MAPEIRIANRRFPGWLARRRLKAITATKRRQTMAEMLRSSELLGGTVAHREAVEAAQEKAARKAEASKAKAAGTAMPGPA